MNLSNFFRRAEDENLPPPPVEATVREPSRGTYYYLGSDIAITRLRDGRLLYIDPRDDHICSYLITHGYWEDWTYKILKSLINSGDTIVEVGANVGYFTVIMADQIGPTGKLVALEANPYIARLLMKSVTMNGLSDRVKVFQQAASDHAGRASFVFNNRNPGAGHLHVASDNANTENEVTEVSTVRLDELGVEKVDLLRVDAEGSEGLILHGAETMISNPDIKICMEWDTIQMANRTDVPAFAEWLANLGFDFWHITHTQGLARVSRDALPSLPSCDLLLSRKPL